MSERFTKNILIGILICLIIIALKPGRNEVMPAAPRVDINENEEIIQLSPNKIAVVDNRNSSGMYGTILVFNYNPQEKKFEYEASMNYQDYFSNPQNYGLPIN